MPKQKCFWLFLWLCDFLEFPLVKSSKIFTAHRIHTAGYKSQTWKKYGLYRQFFFYFCKFISFTCYEKTGLIDFPEKRAPTKVKYLPLVCQIFQIFTKGNSRKFTVSFAFCTHVDVIKYWKTLTFSFECAQITWAFVLSTGAIVKL